MVYGPYSPTFSNASYVQIYPLPQIVTHALTSTSYGAPNPYIPALIYSPGFPFLFPPSSHPMTHAKVNLVQPYPTKKIQHFEYLNVYNSLNLHN